jgi:tetratricopeptide (TPR) repeat protein
MGNGQAAIDAFKASLKLNSHYWPSYIDIALTPRDMGRWDESNEVLFEATSIIPDNAPLHFVYGDNLRITARKREGAEELGKAVALQPRSLKYQLGLAEALSADGKLQDASPLLAGIRTRIASGERIAPDLRAKADALLVHVDAVAKSAE